MNFLLPLLVGGPDMAKGLGPHATGLAGVGKNLSTKNSSTSSLLLNPCNLGSYLAGLFEGDGHIWIQKQVGKKTHNPRFCITFSLKNEALAKKLLGIIGSGFLRYKPKDNACVIVVSPVVGLKRIVNLLNGELKTPKINQLHNLIDWLNKNHSVRFNKLPLNKDNLENSSWLSGFVDADGSFSVQHTKTETGAAKRKISCRLRIEQRILDPSTHEDYFYILNQICLFFNCKLLTRTQKSTGNTYYTLTASSKASLNIIINYFNKYPLFSSKFLDYQDWELVAKLFVNNQHLTSEGINTVEMVRSRMNTKRVDFNWDHLISLY
jgi:LAGLIDADG endonuclease